LPCTSLAAAETAGDAFSRLTPSWLFFPVESKKAATTPAMAPTPTTIQNRALFLLGVEPAEAFDFFVFFVAITFLYDGFITG
jgi:hypothetical protein